MHNQKAYQLPQTATLVFMPQFTPTVLKDVENPVLAHCILLPSVPTNMVESD